MKTAEEWFDIRRKQINEIRNTAPSKEFYEQIQLDAFKAGAEWAAKHCDNELNIVLGASKHTANKIKQNILSASSNLKEIPK